MSNKLADLAINLSANITSFESDMGRAARIAKKESEKMRKQVGVAMKAIAASAVSAAAGLGTVVKMAANTADQIQKMSIRLGVSTEFLSQYRHVAELSGTSLDKVGDGVRKMSKSINDANNGLSTATRAFSSLGISLDEINALSPEAQFELIADRISQVESQSVKAGAAMDIFGRSGSELLTVLDLGSEGIKRMRDEADRFGLTISKNAADAAAHFNDELSRLNARFKGIKESIGRELLPTFTAIIENINSTEISEGARKWDGLNATLINLYAGVLYLDGAFATVGRAVGTLAAQTVQAFDIMFNYVEAFAKRIKLGALTIVQTFADDIIQKAEMLGATDILPDFIKNSSVKESAAQLSAEISALESEAKELTEIFNQGVADDDSMQQAVKRYSEIQKKIDAVRKKYKEAGKSIENDFTSPVDESNNVVNNLSDNISGKTTDVLDNFQSLLEEYQTPLENLNQQYAENTTAIVLFRLANQDNAEAQELALELQKKVNSEYKNSKEAIEGVLSPYDQLLADLDNEIALLSMSSDQLLENEAVRLLMSSGLIKSGDDLSKYSDEIQEVISKLKQLRDATKGITESDTPFAKLAKELEGVFSSVIQNIGGEIEDTIAGLSVQFMQLSNQGGENAQLYRGLGQGLAGVGAFMEAQAAGIDSVGSTLRGIQAGLAQIPVVGQAIAAVAEVINQLTGGGLFGTSYSVESSSRNLNIGTSGGGGGIETVETRERSLWRGTQRRTTQDDLDASTLNALNQLFDSLEVAIQNSAIALGGVAGDIITGSFTETFDADGNLTSSVSEVLGRTFEESFDQFAQRLTAENVLAGISTVFEEVGDIANRWRGDAETLLDGAQFLLQASIDMQAGNGLFNELAGVALVIEDMQKAGESLTATYNRVFDSVRLFDEALEIVGVSFEGARIDYVRLAADITDAAGGLQQAASLWSSYFETFYTEQELFEQNLSSSIGSRDSMLGDLGLDTDISIDEFRELFESALPTLSAEAIVEWLEAADAIGVVIDLEADLNEQREQNAADLAVIIGNINSEIENMGLSPFALRLKEIRKAFNDQIDTARALGASEQELAMIQTYAVRQINNAINELESNIGSGITDLYGTQLDQINEQIELLESQESSIGNVQQASDNLYASQLRAIQNIQGFLNSILLDEQLSPLNPQEQLAEAQSQFDTLLSAAQGGDVDALNALPALAQTLLGFGQDVFASSQDYVDIFNNVRDSLAGLGVTATESDPQTVMIGQNSQMIELLQERNRLEAEFDSDARLQAALEIANQIAELASVTGESFGELAERLGLPVEEFLTDLGVSLDELTVETASALAQTAQLLGVEITDLAESVGISLGDLANDQSLLNDALEQTIRQLPSGIADDLDALLTAIENSTDPSAREELLEQFVEIANSLPEDQRDLLAPYFEDIDPITEAQQQVDQMQSLNNSNIDIRSELQQLREENNNNATQSENAQNNISLSINRLANEIRTLADIAGVA